MVSVGAYRFMLDDMQQRVNGFGEVARWSPRCPMYLPGIGLSDPQKMFRAYSERLQSRA
jgi:hypothetical protein